MEKAAEKKINLYISCSTKSGVLTEQKTTIINLCRKLNEYYAENGFCVRINPVGYDDRESRDDVFEKFTAHTADIVVFLVDKECKDDEQKRLEKELEYVCSSYKEYRRPEVLVYMQDDVYESLKEAVRNKLIINGLGSSTIKNTDALESDVKENIEKYINSYNVLRDIHSKEKRKRFFYYFILFVIVSFFSFVLFWIKYDQASQPRLLIAGGGSAKNLINLEYLNEGDTNKNDILEKIAEHWIYAPIPSENAYLLIMEEAKMGIGDYEKRNYYPIILSASKAVDSSFWKDSKLDFRNVGIIIGIHVGNDSLVVYSSPTINGSPVADLSMREQLLEVIKDTTIQLFTTNAGSGTLRSYLNFLGKEELNPNPEQQQVFYETDSITDTNWIALGSKSYHPKISSKDLSFTIDTLEKQVYIYFLKYKSVKNANYELPEATKKFLEKIHINDSLIVSIQNLQPDKKDTTILFDTFCAYKFHDKSHTHFNK